MAVCGREAARQRMLRRAAARLGEEKACRMTVWGKRHVRLLTNLVSLRIAREHPAVQVRDMHLWPAAEVRDACSCRDIPWAYWTRVYIGSGKYRGLVRLRCVMSWPAGLRYMSLELMIIVHVQTCISTRTDPCRCRFTPTLILLYSCFIYNMYAQYVYYLYICIYIYIYALLLLYIYIYIYVHIYVYTYERMIYIHIHVYDLLLLYSCFIYNMCIICLWSIYI